MIILGVAIAGAIGAPSRYALDLLISRRQSGNFPWGILIVNVIGCTIFGFVTGLVIYQHTSVSVKTIAGTGFCGALTTFSTFSVQTIRLMEAGQWSRAAEYLALSLLLGLTAAAAGLAIASI